MNLGDKLVRRVLLGGFFVIILIVFIVWRRKSTYVYPEATTTPPLGSVSVTGVLSIAETATSPYQIKITTATAHGFVSSTSARDTVIFSGFTTTSKTSLNGPTNQFLINSVPSTTEFTILVPPSIIASGTSITTTDSGASVQSGFNYYQNKLQDAVNQYNINLTNSTLGIYLSGKTTKAASDIEASNVKQASFTSASTEYVKNKCPYAWTGSTATPNPYIDSASKPIITKDPALTAFALYKTTLGDGVSKISTEYNDFFNNTSTAAVQGSNYYLNQTAVQQARRSDITGATREYLSTVCPGFYTDSTGSTLESVYKSWGPGATPYGFTKPTSTQINNWASYAIDSSISGSVNTDGKLVLSIARDLKGQTLTSGGITPKSAIAGNTLIPDATVIASGNLGVYSGIMGVAGNGTLVTVTTALAHGLATGATVIMTGFVPVAINGTYTITVTSPTVFTYSSTAGSATTLGVITPLVAAVTATSPQLVIYTAGSGASAISKPAWQWARDYGPGTTATSLLPTVFQSWGTGALAATTSNLIDTTTYVQ